MDKVFARHRNKNGKFRPWLLRATPLLAVTAIALWTAPTFFDGIPLLVMLFSCKILYEAAYTMFNIPMGSLLSAMSTNDVERASLSSARGVGSMFGNMIPGIVAPFIIEAFGGETNTLGYTVTGIACAAVGFVVCLLHYYMTEERGNVDGVTNADDIKFSDILRVFTDNRPFVALCIHGLCICAMQYTAQTIGAYMYTAVYNDLTYQAIGSILSAPFMGATMIAVPFICKKLGLEKVIRYSLLIGGGIFGLLFAAHMITFVHPLVHGVVSGIASGMAMVSIQMQWGLVGEAIDYNEYKLGKRTEGSIYGTFNLSRRIGQTIGQTCSIYALSWIGYNGGADVQTDGTIVGLKVLCVLVPAIFVIGSWAAFKFIWNISPEVRAKMAAHKLAQAGGKAVEAVAVETIDLGGETIEITESDETASASVTSSDSEE